MKTTCILLPLLFFIINTTPRAQEPQNYDFQKIQGKDFHTAANQQDAGLRNISVRQIPVKSDIRVTPKKKKIKAYQSRKSNIVNTQAYKFAGDMYNANINSSYRLPQTAAPPKKSPARSKRAKFQ